MFRVPTHELREHSQVFREILSLPTEGDGDEKGMCDDDPICLEGIKKEDFKLLLQILYLP